MIKIWKNTKTLDLYSKHLAFTTQKNEADIILAGSKLVTLEEFDNLKAIFRAGVSRNNIPEKEAKEKGIIVRYPSDKTVEVIYEETANYTCSLIFRTNYSNVGSLNLWAKNDRVSLTQKNLLVIGTGNIGSRVISKMKNFMNVFSFDIRESSVEELFTLLPQADFVSLHIPSSEENEKFIDTEKLALLKDNAAVINTARGDIVSELALLKELKTKRLRAAFDVFWQEPYNGELKQYHPDYFYMSPHIASTCVDFLLGCKHDLDNLILELTNE